MDQAVQIDWLWRTMQHVQAGTTDVGPAAVRVDVARYVDQEFARRETDRLFRALPIAAGFSDRLKNPGDFFTHDYLGLPLLLVRGRDGVIRAFLNVCRHRGARVVPQREGCRHRFSCPYHAWTYDTEGKLLALPHEASFGDLDRSAHGLVQIPAGEAFGVIFVLPDPKGKLDLDRYLGQVKADLEGFGLHRHVVHDQREIGFRANWKVVVEGGLETYHVRHAHAQTIAPMFIDNLAVADRLGLHARLYFTKQAARDISGPDLASLSVRSFGNPLYFCFPNLVVLVQPDHATVMIVYPDGVDGCRILGGALIPEPAATEKARAYWDKNVKIFWDALDEDFRMAVSIQSGMRSGANREIVFGRFEQACAWFNQSLDDVLAGGVANR